MKRPFYFTTETMCDGECTISDYSGNVRGARTYAKKYANELKETVYINDCITEDIIDCVYPDADKEEK